jgi:D-alanine-D-alanine ligase
MKILVLFDLAHPADPNGEFSPESLKEQDKPTEACVLACLRRLGHEIDTLPVFNNVTAIVEKLKACAPDVVFNLSESFYHDRSHEPNIPALLELMNVKYTGAGPDGLLLCKDKALAKELLAYHRVRLPHFVVSHHAHRLRRLRRFVIRRSSGGRGRIVGRHQQGVLRARGERGDRAGALHPSEVQLRRLDRGIALKGVSCTSACWEITA